MIQTNKIIIQANPPVIHICSGENKKLSSAIPPAFIKKDNYIYSLKDIFSQRKTDCSEKIIWNTDCPGLQVNLTINTFDNFIEFLWHREKEGMLCVTFDISPVRHWYGQGTLTHQKWPLNKGNLPFAPLITSDNGPTGLGNIQTPLWWSSDGTGIWVEEAENLYTGFNSLKSGTEDGLLTIGTETSRLKVILFTGETIPESYNFFIKKALPKKIPPERLMTLPIWTTWALYKTDINQEKVLSFAKAIREHSFPGGTIEIDDMWQSDYGDFTFHPEKFPEPEEMIKELHEMDFRITLWITPFFNPSSKNFAEGLKKGYFISKDGSPANIPWWNGNGALLNIMDGKATEWFKDKLKKLEKKGIDGFKFDAGEASFLEENFIDRNNYSRYWTDFASKHFPYGEVRTGWHNHSSPMLFRQWDKFSIWGENNGLASIIPQALTMSLTGYPFILPDIIGGNFYGEEKIDKELMIRWTQVTALMPSMQFGYPPWMFDEETERICRFYGELHCKFGEEIIRLAKEATITGIPIIRPLFWADPHDINTYDISDEFLLGDKYLIAPVITPERQRNIYLPRGLWEEYWSQKIYEGPIFLSEYKVNPDCLPIFHKI